VEGDIVLFRKFLELFPGGLDVFIASRRLSQHDNGINIVRSLPEHCERLVFCVGETSDCQITTGEPDPIFNVIRIQHAGISQKCGGTQGRGVLQPHCSVSFVCERVFGVQLQHVEVAQLGFVVVARFKIIVGLGK
jgi:hypothetical protein